VEVTTMATSSSTRFRDQETRNLLALAVALDPTAAPIVRRFLKMKAYNIRHDWMYVLNKATGKYDRVPDPCAFNADLDAFGGKNNMGVSLMRSRDGEWFLHGS
jgi:hypothetical protein